LRACPTVPKRNERGFGKIVALGSIAAKIGLLTLAAFRP